MRTELPPRHSAGRLLGLLLLWFAAAPMPLAAATQALDHALTLSFRDTPIQEVYEMLSREGRVNILLGRDLQAKVSVNLYQVSLDTAVRAIAQAAGFVVERRGDTYFVLKRDDAGKDSTRGNTQVRTFKVQYSATDKVETILTEHLSRYGKITALKERNLLVIEDLPEFLERIQRILAEVDQQPRQILIEAKILEISLTDDQTYGVDWSAPFGPADRGSSLGTTGLAPGGAGLFLNLFTRKLDLKLNALNEKGRVRTLSTPKLVVLEDQEAEVIIGDRIGFKVTTIVDQVVTESIEFLESGVILKVKASVDRAGRILMDIHPEVSTASVTNNIPSLKTTEVTTQLLAVDGQKIFMGGLIKNELGENRSGVPVLGDLPVVGGLFSNTTNRMLKTETVVLITPHIVSLETDTLATDLAARVAETERGLSLKVDETLTAIAARAVQSAPTGREKPVAGDADPFWWQTE